MASNVQLAAQPRQERRKGGSRKLRATGRIPAVVYGHGEETRALSVDAHELERLFSTIHRESTIINLKIEGEKAEVRALVREVQEHPLKRNILHVDFYQIHAGERITVEVPIVLLGTPAGVRAGGILQHTMNEIEIRVSADAIPDEIRVDVSALDVGDSIHVADLTLPEGVEVLVDADRSVCSVTAPSVAQVAVPAEGVEPVAAVAEPEVIRRKKEEESAT